MSSRLLASHLSGSDLRRWVLRYGTFLCGAGMVVPLLVAVPLLGSLPSITIAPYLPLMLAGILYWIGAGHYRDSLAIWLILFVFVLGLLGSSQPSSAIGQLIVVLTMIAVSALIVDESDWVIASRVFLIGFISSAAVLSHSLWFSAAWYSTRGDRLGFVVDAADNRILDPNYVGFHAGFALLVALSVITNKQSGEYARVDRVFAIVGIAVASFVVLFSQSLGAAVSTAGALVVMFVFGRSFQRWRTWLITASAGVIVVLLIAVLDPAILERVTAGRVGSAGGRTPIWSSAIEVATQNVPAFLFGAGLGDGPAVLGRYDPGLRSHLTSGGPPQVVSVGDSITIGVHSTYVSWLLDFGVVGLFLAGVAVILAFIRARTVDGGRFLAVATGMIALFLLVSITQTAYSIAFGISAGCGGMALGYLYFNRSQKSTVVTIREGTYPVGSPHRNAQFSPLSQMKQTEL